MQAQNKISSDLTAADSFSGNKKWMTILPNLASCFNKIPTSSRRKIQPFVAPVA